MATQHRPEVARIDRKPELVGALSATGMAETHDDEPDDEFGPSGEADGPIAAPPARVGRYVILSLLGVGGMGAVYTAYDPELDRKVALKLLHPDAASQDGARMIQEARTLAKLAHPNVVSVHDVGATQGGVFIAMELVDGTTVTRWLKQRTRSLRELLDVFLAAGRGLDAAHRASVIHRDFKPDNIMVGRDGRVRVLDFGLARSDLGPSPEETQPEGQIDPSANAAGPRLTREGALMGTPSYMAPEQWNRQPADPRTDQFSFCVSLWEALYGERPFQGPTLAALMIAVTDGRLSAPASERRVPAAIRRALERGLSLRPEDRFPAMAALLAVLERVEASRRRKVMWAGLAVLGCIAGGIVGIRMQRIAACERAGDEISQVWNDGARASLQAALAASHVSYAESSFQRAAAHLDAWTATWSRLRSQTCREAEVDGTRSPELYARSTACLEEREDELAIVLAEFSTPSATTDAARLVPNIVDLSPLAPCGERDALERRPALPADPEARHAVAELRREDLRVRGLVAAGHADEARTRAAQLLASAEALEYRPLIVETQLLVAGMTRGPGAVDMLRRIYVDANDIGADEVAALAATRLVTRLGIDAARPAEGLQWALPAEVIVRRLGQDRGLLGASLRDNQALVLRAQGSYDKALTYHEQALAIREEVLGPMHPGVAATLNSLANVQRDRGEHDAALAAITRALAIRRESLGPDHPVVAATLNNLGLLEQARGRYAQAQPHLEQALAINTAAFGEDSLGAAITLNNLGRLQHLRGNYTEAKLLLEKALEIRERRLGPQDLDLAVTLQTLGLLALVRGERIKSRELLERVLAIRERRMEDSNPEILNILDSLGTLNYRIGDLDRAQTFHERALALQRSSLGPHHLHVANSLRGLAQVHAIRGDRGRALALANEALAIAERAVGPEHTELAAFLNVLGTLLRKTDSTAARAYVERALKISMRTKGPRHPATATSLQRLAELHLDAGEFAEAQQNFTQALEIREALGPEVPELADVLAGLGTLALARGLVEDAIPPLERALTIRSRDGIPRHQLAEVQFLLARALKRTDPGRSRQLATEAAAGFRDAGHGFDADRAAVEVWARE